MSFRVAAKVLHAVMKDGGPKDTKGWARVELSDYGYKTLGNGHFGSVVCHPAHPDVVFKIGMVRDHAYLAYVTYCMVNSGALWMPVIHGIYIFDQYYIVIMEQLRADEAQAQAAISSLLCKREVGRLQDVLGKFDDLHAQNVMYRGDQPVITDPYCRVLPTVYNPDSSGEVTPETIMRKLHATQMANRGASAAIEREEEDRALRFLSFAEREPYVECIQRLLPQMRGILLCGRQITEIIKRLVRACEYGRPHVVSTCGLHFRVQDGQCHLTPRPNMDAEGRHWRIFERAIQIGVERALGPRRIAFDRGFPVPQGASRRHAAEILAERPRQFGIPDGAIRGRRGDIIIADELGPNFIHTLDAHMLNRMVVPHVIRNDLWPAMFPKLGNHDFVPVRKEVRSDPYRGRVERYKGRTIHPNWRAARDVVCRAADEIDRPQPDCITEDRGVDRSRQSRRDRIRQDSQAAVAHGLRVRPREIRTRPEEPQ